jgi:hypothetical protein
MTCSTASALACDVLTKRTAARHTSPTVAGTTTRSMQRRRRQQQQQRTFHTSSRSPGAESAREKSDIVFGARMASGGGNTRRQWH